MRKGYFVIDCRFELTAKLPAATFRLAANDYQTFSID